MNVPVYFSNIERKLQVWDTRSLEFKYTVEKHVFSTKSNTGDGAG